VMKKAKELLWGTAVERLTGRKEGEFRADEFAPTGLPANDRDIAGVCAYREAAGQESQEDRMPKHRVTSTKRQREQAKRERQQRKAERRANRKAGQTEDATAPEDAELYPNEAP